MPRLPLFLVDAFSDRPLTGNACAVVFDANDLDDDTMLAITREMNQAETAFVTDYGPDHARVRYFTPRSEIPLAGHPTIATAFALATQGRLPLTAETTSVTFELIEGPINVDLHADTTGKVSGVTMTQRKPKFLDIHDPAEVMPIFGLKPSDLMPGKPIQTVSTGTPQMMIPLATHAALRGATFQEEPYNAYRDQSDFFSAHLFCLGGATNAGETFARHFDSPPGPIEDAFTGSATGGMAAYLWSHGLLERPAFTAQQGHWMNRPGQARVSVHGPRENVEKVTVRGAAVTVVKGELQY